jgi:hypothetical protein
LSNKNGFYALPQVDFKFFSDRLRRKEERDEKG